jgi:hypothetical protein
MRRSAEIEKRHVSGVSRPSFASMLGLAALVKFVVSANELPAVFTPWGPGTDRTRRNSAGHHSHESGIPILVATRVSKALMRYAILACVVIGAISYAFLASLDYFGFRRAWLAPLISLPSRNHPRFNQATPTAKLRNS